MRFEFVLRPPTTMCAYSLLVLPELIASSHFSESNKLEAKQWRRDKQRIYRMTVTKLNIQSISLDR